MNIMLASISERVREIGIRKSVGASTADIFIQILVESVAIAMLGGAAGLGASFILVHFLGSVSPTENAPIITGGTMLLAFSFSVAVGVLAGIFPAIKAARLNPIQAFALRIIMTLTNTILIGFKEVWSHKFRSLLTMLGIILGVASLVGMAAIIKGMENGMKEAMIAMGGADKVLLESQDVPPEQEHLADQAPGRTMDDVKALRESAPLLRLVSPEMSVNGAAFGTGRGNRGVPSECVGVVAGCVGNEPPHVGARTLLHRSGRGEREPGMRHWHGDPR